MGRAYKVVWGQCSEQMRSKVESMDGYATVHGASNLLGLLNMIKKASLDFHSRKKNYIAIVETERAFKSFQQVEGTSCEEYHEKLKSLSEAFIACGGSIGKVEGPIITALSQGGLNMATASAGEPNLAEEKAKTDTLHVSSSKNQIKNDSVNSSKI